MKRIGWLCAVAAWLLGTDARALESNYVGLSAGTTLAYRPPGRSFEGAQRDVTPMIALGHLVTGLVAIELDAGPCFVKSKFDSFELEPSVVFAFHSNFYGAARFLVPVASRLNFGIAPGLGFTFGTSAGVSPFVEANAVSMLARGAPDFGATVTVGASYAF